MILDTLYKRTKTTAIQYWKIDVLPATDGAIIVKEVGQLGTSNPIVHRESVTKGKNIGKANETSPSQQAMLQAESDWKRKKDEGYKSLIDLGYDVVGAKGGEQTSEALYKILDKLLPQFNTDASGNVKPMLAKDWDGGKKVKKYPVYGQPKLDGVRCLMVVERDGDGIAITFLSRSGKEYTTLGHIDTNIREKGQIFWDAGKTILDGEIYSDELTFQEIIEAVKKQRPQSLKLKFRAYDIVNENTQEQRLKDVKELVEKIGSEHIILVKTYTLENQLDVESMHDVLVKEGNEGLMVRIPTGKYAQGQRSSDLLKVKQFDETEFKFISFERGAREEDLIAVCTDGIHEFKAKMVGNKQQKEKLWLDCAKLSGKQITIKHFGYTDDNIPRFPIGKAFRNYE